MAELSDGKAALIAQLETARARLAVHSQGAQAHLHPGVKMRETFERQRVAWLGGAALLGLIITRLPRTKKVVVRRKGGREELAKAGKAGIAVGALKMAIDLAKPLLIAWATKRIGDVAKSAEQTERKVDQTKAKVEKVERQTN